MNGVIRTLKFGRIKIEPIKGTPHHIIWQWDPNYERAIESTDIESAPPLINDKRSPQGPAPVEEEQVRFAPFFPGDPSYWTCATPTT